MTGKPHVTTEVGCILDGIGDNRRLFEGKLQEIKKTKESDAHHRAFLRRDRTHCRYHLSEIKARTK